MKNYLVLSDVSNFVSAIIPRGKSKLETTKKEKPFVILNSDKDFGFYVERLRREIKSFPELKELTKVLRKKSLKNIETGDLIVFGDQTGNVNYDYRVETNPDKLDHLDGRRFKVYDLIVDFEQVIKRLRKYVAANYNHNGLVIVDDEDDVRETNINVNINVSSLLGRRPKYQRPLISIVQPRVSEQKVTIFDNWVKVGYNQYDIMVDLFGKEFIYVAGRKYFVKSDRYGVKYLTE